MAAVAGILALAGGAASVLARRAPSAAADVARGSEEAFGRGLHRRELPAGAGPQRWTTPRASFLFRDLPLTAATLGVEIRDSRGPVAVIADGILVGRLDAGPRGATFALPPTGRRTRVVELWAEPFQAGDGRVLGARLGRVTVDAPGSWRPPPLVLLELLLPGLLALAAGRLAGMSAASALALGVAIVAIAAAALWPSGLVHSPYAPRLSALLCAGAVAALGFARMVGRSYPGAAPAALVALLAGWTVQVVLGTSPLMVVSDAVFHANKLAAVAGGDLFPTSVTQHARPFRFPYGVSFYALLAPLARAGVDGVALVRIGTALAGLAATVAVFLLALACSGPRAAVLSALILQALPGAFDIAYSYGNFSNAFGQAATVLLFCWWAGRARGGPLVGGALLALAALAHFSSFVFVGTLAVALALVEWRAGDRDGKRLWAAGLGLLAAGLYYAHFAPMVWEQLPRLFEGGGQGRGASRSAWDAARLQVLGALGQWGLPAIVLAWVGRPRWTRGGHCERDLAAYWVAGLALAVPAVVSPLEVRYLYGLTAALALSAGRGMARLDAAGGARRLAAWALGIAQAALGARAIVEAVVLRYRP